MDRTPGNEPSNPIARAFSKFFERGKVGNKADTPARTTPGAAQRTAPRAQTTPSQTPRAAAPRAPLAGTAGATTRPAARQPTTGQPAQGAAPARPTTVAVPRTYTVASGDSLSKIAQRVYGRADRWTLIFEANRDKIADPDRIYPGQVLVIPDTQSLH